AAAGRRDARRHQRAQRPEVRSLVARPQHAVGLLAAPAAAAEEHAAPGPVRFVERALHRAPVQAAVAPRALRAGRAVGEAQVLADVVALAVVGLDALDAQAQHAHGLRAPPRLALGVGEVDHRPRAHPPARDVRLAPGVANEALRLV